METREKKVLVMGVIGADVHAVGNKILYHAFTEAGFEVVNLGVMVSQEEYIAAAIEANAVRTANTQTLFFIIRTLC